MNYLNFRKTICVKGSVQITNARIPHKSRIIRRKENINNIKL